jgi:hypothetical protein
MTLDHDLYYAIITYIQTQRGGFQSQVLQQWLGHKLLKNSQINESEAQYLELRLKEQLDKLKTIRKSQYSGYKLQTQVRMVK